VRAFRSWFVSLGVFAASFFETFFAKVFSQRFSKVLRQVFLKGFVMAVFESMEEIAARKGFGIDVQHEKKMALLDRVRKYFMAKYKAKTPVKYLTDVIADLDGRKASDAKAKYGFASADYSAVYTAIREAKRRDMLAVEYGITIGAPSAKVKEATQTSGAFVSGVEKDSPAWKAGIRSNDAFHRVQADWTLEDGVTKGICYIYSRFEKQADGSNGWTTYQIEAPQVPENRYKLAGKINEVFAYEATAPEVARSKTLDDIVAVERPAEVVTSEWESLLADEDGEAEGSESNLPSVNV
jgi:hypothetical protein